MKKFTKLTAVAVALFAAPAFAGKGGSNTAIVQAVQSGSQDAIIAEVERAEGLMCGECIQTVTNLTEDNRVAIREVAAWWFAKRPSLAAGMAKTFIGELDTGSTLQVRNAADFLGMAVRYEALPALRKAAQRTDLGSEAKLALVRAAKYLAHTDGNPILTVEMNDADPQVRAAAVLAWRDVLGQANAAPVEGRLTDGDAQVRAAAATVIGEFADAAVRTTLEQLVVSDASPFVRRNAAWALGKIGSLDSRPALLTATADKSGLVKGIAKAALATLK